MPLLALIAVCSMAVIPLTGGTIIFPSRGDTTVGDVGVSPSASSLGSFFTIESSSGKSGNPSSAGRTCIPGYNQSMHQSAIKDEHTPKSPKKPIEHRSSARFGPAAVGADDAAPVTASGPSHSNRTPGIRPASSLMRSLMLSRLRRSTALCDSRRRRRFSERCESGSCCLTAELDVGGTLGRLLTCEAGREDGRWCEVMAPMDILLKSTSVGDIPMLGVAARFTDG